MAVALSASYAIEAIALAMCFLLGTFCMITSTIGHEQPHISVRKRTLGNLDDVGIAV